MKNKIYIFIIISCLAALKVSDTIYYIHYDRYSPVYKSNDIQIHSKIKEISSFPSNSGAKIKSKFTLDEFNNFGTDRLRRVPGIGPVTAGKIIEYRKKKGKFKKIEELKNIRGIGDIKLKQIKKRIISS